jgi:hypothetical protein
MFVKTVNGIVLLMLCAVTWGFSQTATLTIQHPQQTWRQGKGTETSIVWDGRNNEGLTVGTGMYMAILQGPSMRASLKLLLVK